MKLFMITPLFFIFLSSCHKEKNLENSPSGYLKCKVNGQEWTSSDCSFTQIFGVLTINATKQNSSSAVSIYSMGYDEESELVFNQSANHSGIYSSDGNENDFSTSYSYNRGRGKAIFSSVNNKEIMGAFYFTAYNVAETDSITITEGVFKAKNIF